MTNLETELLAALERMLEIVNTVPSLSPLEGLAANEARALIAKSRAAWADDQNAFFVARDRNDNCARLLSEVIKVLESWGRYGEAMKEFGRGHDGTSAALGTSNEYFIGCLRAALDVRTSAAVKQSLDWQSEARAKAAKMEAERPFPLPSSFGFGALSDYPDHGIEADQARKAGV